MSFYYEDRHTRRNKDGKQVLLQIFSPDSKNAPDSAVSETVSAYTSKPTTSGLDKATGPAQAIVIQRLGERLLEQGAYLQVIDHYNKAADTFYKCGCVNEALLFLNKATELKKWVIQRESKKKLLKKATYEKNSLEMMTLMKELVELSKKLRDTTSVEYFSDELEQYKRMRPPSRKNRSATPSAPKKSEFTLNPTQKRLNTIAQLENLHVSRNKSSLKFTINAHLQEFAIKDLELRREKLDSQAIPLERRGFYISAASLYEKCASISEQLSQLGHPEKAEVIEKYRRKKEECLSKVSQKKDSRSPIHY